MATHFLILQAVLNNDIQYNDYTDVQNIRLIAQKLREFLHLFCIQDAVVMATNFLTLTKKGPAHLHTLITLTTLHYN